MLVFSVLYLLILLTFFHAVSLAYVNLEGPLPYSHPEEVVKEVHRRTNVAIFKKMLQESSAGSSYHFTGNPIDDCLQSLPVTDFMSLGNCAIGFGAQAKGGQGGKIYVVNDSSDDNVVNPMNGTLRHGVIQNEPLWIIFSTDMVISLSQELVFNSHKSVDGRGARVRITGGGCITLQYISNVIIHNIEIYNCIPSGGTYVRTTPTKVGYRGQSDGDAISIFGSYHIWIDHCELHDCYDGLIDAVMGSTKITVSNCHFYHHDKVMLLGHHDDYGPDDGMQVTIAFNYFGSNLVQRMPRCRRGFFHVVNNVYSRWQMYAIGGSANSTIISQGNVYVAPDDSKAKMVTKRIDAEPEQWQRWLWVSLSDKLDNDAMFEQSGYWNGIIPFYADDGYKPNFIVGADLISAGAGVHDVPHRYQETSPSNPVNDGSYFIWGSSSVANSFDVSMTLLISVLCFVLLIRSS